MIRPRSRNQPRVKIWAILILVLILPTGYFLGYQAIAVLSYPFGTPDLAPSPFQPPTVFDGPPPPSATNLIFLNIGVIYSSLNTLIRGLAWLGSASPLPI